MDVNNGEDCTVHCPSFDNGVGVFDGVGDHIDLEEDSDNLDGPLTMALWFKPALTITGGNTGTMRLFGRGAFADTLTGSFSMGITGSSSKVGLWLSDGVSSDSVLSIQNTWNINQWYHVVATWDGTTNTNGMNLYVEGVLKNQRTATKSLLQDLGEFGISGYGSSTQMFNGSIDEVMIFDRSLSENEITAIYNNQLK